MKNVFLVLSLIAATGCSSQGFHQAELREAVAEPTQITGDEVKAALSKVPQLPKPFRLGVYFREPELRGAEGGLWNRWSAEEKAKIFSAVRAARGDGVSAVFPILTAVSGDMDSVRVAAARQRADAVLVISAASETVTNPNGLAFGYALVLPLFFLHGTDVETLYYTRASLWDVRNEYLYLAAEGEGRAKNSRPFTATHEREQIEEARGKSLENLCQQLTVEGGELLQSAMN